MKYIAGVAILYILTIPHGVFAQVVISEIMYDPPGNDSTHEWIEIHNEGIGVFDTAHVSLVVNGKAHVLKIVNGSASLARGGYAVIAANALVFEHDYPSFSGTLLHASFSLKNSEGTLTLRDAKKVQIDSLAYTNSEGASGDGNSLNRMNGDTLVARSPSPASSLSDTALKAVTTSLKASIKSSKRTGTHAGKKTAVQKEPVVQEDTAGEAGVVPEVTSETPAVSQAALVAVSLIPSSKWLLALFGIIGLSGTGMYAAREYAKREWSIIEEDE